MITKTMEHDGHDLNVDILLLVLEIADQNNFCVVERLTPLKVLVSLALYGRQTLP